MIIKLFYIDVNYIFCNCGSQPLSCCLITYILKTVDPDVNKTAKNMKADGLPTEAIKKYTGLTDEQIKKI
ncbi:MAG: hypothetical protein OCD02_03100 [Spirochaetaceae bacterium]